MGITARTRTCEPRSGDCTVIDRVGAGMAAAALNTTAATSNPSATRGLAGEPPTAAAITIFESDRTWCFFS
jgi:hypothetical protein